MAVISTPTPVWFGFLVWIAGKIEAISWRLWRLARDLETVWLLGPRLSAPLDTLHTWLLDAARWVRDFDYNVRSWLGWVRHIIDGWGFIKLLDWASGEYRLIRMNAQNWVALKLIAISSNFWWIINNPAQFVRQYLTPLVSWWTSFINNPVGWVKARISQTAYWWTQFLSNPAYQIIHWLRTNVWFFDRMLIDAAGLIRYYLKGRWWWVGQLIDNPIGFVKNYVKRAFPELASFLANPTYWLRTKIASVLQMPADFVNRPGYWLAYSLLQNIKNVAFSFAGAFENLVCDIVLFFM